MRLRTFEKKKLVFPHRALNWMVCITQAKCVYCTVKGKSKAQCKGKGHSITCHEGTEGEYRYDCTLSLTSALDGDGWLTRSPSHFTPRINWYPLYRRLGGQVLYVRVRRISSNRDSILHGIYIFVCVCVSTHVRFVADSATLGQVFVQVFRSALAKIIQLMLHIPY